MPANPPASSALARTVVSILPPLCFVFVNPANDHVPDAGSNSSLDLVWSIPSKPPAINTRPSSSTVALWKARIHGVIPADDHVSVVGSKNSGRLEQHPPPYPSPPTTMTRPSCKVEAVWPPRGTLMGGT